MADPAQFEINRGSDLSFAFNWPDGAGGNADLTGYTVDIVFPQATVTSALSTTQTIDVTSPAPSTALEVSAALTTPSSGLITVTMQWNDALPLGNISSFRVRITAPDTTTTTTNEMRVTVV